jgi:hypothetical protein
MGGRTGALTTRIGGPGVIKDLAIFGVAGLVALELLFPLDYAVRSVLVMLVASLSFYRLAASESAPQLYRGILYLGAIALVAAQGLLLARDLQGPPVTWDFMAFYFDAHVARYGGSLYDPAEYHAAVARLDGILGALGVVLDDVFMQEAVDTGYKNPPFTAFVIYPMTFLPMGASHVAWRIAMAASVLLLVVLLSRHISRQFQPIGKLTFWDYLAFTLLIALSIRGTTATIGYGQTSALVAVFLFLALAAGERSRAGLWAALGIIVKPVAAIMFPVFFVLRGWKRLFTAIGVLLAAIAASAMLFGVDDWASYLRQEYVERSPAWIFYQDNTTSLLAEIMRWKGVEDYPWTSPGLMELFYGISFTLLGLASLIAFRYGRSHPMLSASLLITIGLIVYPGTQLSYGVMTAVPLAVVLPELWARRQDVTINVVVLCAVIGLLNYIPILAWSFLAAVNVVLLLVPAGSGGQRAAGLRRETT